MNRRTLLKAGVVSSLVPMLSSSGITTALGLRPQAMLSGIISDSRFSASQIFGTQGANLGVRHFSSKGDLTSLWFRHLDPLWKKEQLSFAGLTTRDNLFCLERLAWDRGMRVVARLDHQQVDDNQLLHTLEGTALLSVPITENMLRRATWSMEVGRAIATCPPEHLVAPCALREVRSVGWLEEPLVTWVIAPIAQA